MSKHIVNNSIFWKPNNKNDLLFYKGDFTFFESDKHIHEEYTVTFIQKDDMKTFIDGFSQTFNKSTILTINPDKVHSCKTKSDLGYKYNSVYFKKSFLENIFSENLNFSDLYFRDSSINNEHIHNRLTSLFLQNEQNQLSKIEFECEIIDILKMIMNVNSSIIKKTDIKVSDLKIKRAIEFMDQNYFLDIGLDDIIEHIGISKYYFIRMFKNKMHVSPHVYLMLKRIEKAKKSLQKGNSLVYTAHNCGFNDQSHMTKRFKASMGITPGLYKNFFK